MVLADVADDSSKARHNLCRRNLTYKPRLCGGWRVGALAACGRNRREGNK